MHVHHIIHLHQWLRWIEHHTYHSIRTTKAVCCQTMLAYMHFHHIIANSSLSVITSIGHHTYQFPWSWHIIHLVMVSPSLWYPPRYGIHLVMVSTSLWYPPRYGIHLVMVSTYWSSSSFDTSIHITPLYSKAPLYIIITMVVQYEIYIYIYATGLLEIKIPYYYIYDCVDS